MISCRHKVTIFFQSFAYSTYIIYTHGHSFSANGMPWAEVSNFLSFFFIGKTKERKDVKGIKGTLRDERDERDFKDQRDQRDQRDEREVAISRCPRPSLMSLLSLSSLSSLMSLSHSVTRCHMSHTTPTPVTV